MSSRDYERTLVQGLERMGFVVESGPAPGEYIVSAQGDTALPLRPKLSLADDVLADYLAAMADDGRAHGLGEGDPMSEALSMVMIHLEEELSTVDLDGKNYATRVGVERGPDGAARWFAERANPGEPPRYSAAAGDLVWVADPPAVDRP